MLYVRTIQHRSGIVIPKSAKIVSFVQDSVIFESEFGATSCDEQMKAITLIATILRHRKISAYLLGCMI